MRKPIAGTLSLAFLLLLASCSSADDVIDSSGSCTEYNLGITPFNPPVLPCGPNGFETDRVMTELNDFWGSNAVACACASAECVGSIGLVLPHDPARIYYEVNVLAAWDSQFGTTLPADILMAHEFGHLVQINQQLPGTQRELQADCLAGFFLGSRVCEETASQFDVMQTFQAFCNIGSPGGATWFNPATHGNCQQRASAVGQGMAGYLQGLLPGQACP